MVECSCDVSFTNTGRANCIPVIGIARKFIVVPTYDSTGAKNYISTASALTDTAINALINQADRSKRWYPLPKVKNVELAKSEPKFQDFNDGSKKLVKDGVRSGKALFVDSVTPALVGVLNGGRCTDLSVYTVDNNGALVGYSYGETGKIYPMPLNKSTMFAIYQFATDSTVPTAELNMEFDVDLRDEWIIMVQAANITNINMLNVNGLIDVYATQAPISTTSFSSKLFLHEGDAVTPIVVTGLTITDFVLYNVTDSLAVTILTCTESPDGTYTFTFAAQTSADVLRLTPTKAGYDFENAIASTVTIP